MKKAIFMLDGLRGTVDMDRYSRKLQDIGYGFGLEDRIVDDADLPSDTLILAEGRYFPKTISRILSLNRKDLFLVGVSPLWDDEIKHELHRVEIPVLILSYSSDLSKEGISAMKYHDRIAGSTVKYLKGGEKNLRHPERLIQILQEWLDENKDSYHTDTD